MYASQVLGWPIHRDGDRYLSLAPGSTNTTALIVHTDTWYDFKTGYNGDVIDLCAMARHDGDKGLAIRELGQGFQGSFDESKWKAKTQELCNKIQYFHEQLRDIDREYLHTRAINDETIERLKLGFDEITYTLTIPYFKNGAAVYWAGRDRWSSAEPVQYLDGVGDGSTETVRDWNPATGEVFKYEHVNPEWLVWQEKSKGRSKYHKAALNGYNENIPWGLHTLTPEYRKTRNAELCEKFSQGDKVLCILEGAFDVMSFEQEGFICLSPIGGYFNKNVNQFVIDIAKQFDYVFVCFDSDAPGQSFNMRMAQLLFANRIPFVIGQLPKDINNRTIKDVSDYYTLGGSLISLVRNAQDGIIALAGAIRDKNEFKDFIYKCARYVDKPDLIQLFMHVKKLDHFDEHWLRAIQQECLKAPSEKIIVDELKKKYLIKYQEGVGFYIYDKLGYWKFFNDNEIKNVIADQLGVFANGGRLNTIFTLMKAVFSCRDEFNKDSVVNFPNGILDLETGEIKSHSASFMTNHQMDYKYDPEAKCPKWDKFISEIMAGDEAKINLLHEILGYILVPDLRFQKCFIFYGEGANGKSVVINTAIKLFGHDVCTSVPMSLLASQFEPIRLKNSWVNFMTETETNLKDAEARFKAIVAGDIISAAHKGKDAIEFATRAPMIMATNNHFKTSDTSKGFIRRIQFLGFNQTFEGKRANKNLTNELSEELPGIFNRIYEGYKRLLEDGAFTHTDEQQELINEFMKMSEPVEAYADEDLCELAGEWTSHMLYTRYTEWCQHAGQKAQARNRFTRSLRLVLERRFKDVQIIRRAKGYVYVFPKKNAEPEDNKIAIVQSLPPEYEPKPKIEELYPEVFNQDSEPEQGSENYDENLYSDYFENDDDEPEFDNSSENDNNYGEIPF